MADRLGFTKNGQKRTERGEGVRTSEIEKITAAHFSLFLLKIIYANESFSFLVFVRVLLCV